MKKLANIILPLILCIILLTGCANSKSQNENASGIKMYLTVSTADNFSVKTIIDSAKKHASEAGAELVVKDAEGSLENQLAHLEEAVMADMMLFYVTGRHRYSTSASGSCWRFTYCIFQLMS